MSKYKAKTQYAAVKEDGEVLKFCRSEAPKHKGVFCFRKAEHRGKHRNGRVEW